MGAAFIEATHPISIIMGPAGSGKTVASAYKGIHLAGSWFPVCRDGVIRVKLTILRDVYRDMSRTALESWHNERLFPKDHPWTVEYTGGIDRPTTHKLKFGVIRDRRTVPVEFTAYFAAIGDANPEQFAKGFETSAVWVNECDMHHERIPGLMFSRTGRYPSVDQIAPSELDRVMRPFMDVMRKAGMKLDDDEVVLPRILWGDCNPPDPDNWVNTKLIEGAEDWPMYKLFRQPSGLSSLAENRKGKPRSAYEQDLQTMTPTDARRFVHGEIGYAVDGKPVYADEFVATKHLADQPLFIDPRVPLSLGMDAGGSPACKISQFWPNGQWRHLREICADPGTGPARFAKMIYEVLLADFRGIPIGEAYADPSSWHGADTAAGELSWVQTVEQALQIRIFPPGSNDPGTRQDAVKWYLTHDIDNKTPGMLIDPSCKRTRGAYAAHYKLTKRSSAGETKKIMVADNPYTHIADADQYVALGHRGLANVINESANMGRGANVVPMRGHVVRPASFNVFKR